MSRWVQELARFQETGTPVILVTVASTKGSVPRNAGTRMIVSGERIFGTIGGGHLELKSIATAREMLISGDVAAMRRFPLGASLGQCCGGIVNLLFEPVSPHSAWVKKLVDALKSRGLVAMLTALHDHQIAQKVIASDQDSIGSIDGIDAELGAIIFNQLGHGKQAGVIKSMGGEYLLESVDTGAFHVWLFGAGHVGRALVRLLGELDCRVTWIDSRESEFPLDVPGNVEILRTDDPASEIDDIRPGGYILTMTHSHGLDQAIAEAVLRKGDFSYFGLIGSRTKRSLFERRLLAMGVPRARLERMTCPIGETAISSKEPTAIAIGVAMQLLRHHEKNGLEAAPLLDLQLMTQ